MLYLLYFVSPKIFSSSCIPNKHGSVSAPPMSIFRSILCFFFPLSILPCFVLFSPFLSPNISSSPCILNHHVAVSAPPICFLFYLALFCHCSYLLCQASSIFSISYLTVLSLLPCIINHHGASASSLSVPRSTLCTALPYIYRFLLCSLFSI